MIPEHEPAPRPPLSLEFAFLMALVAPLAQLLWVILFARIGFHLPEAQLGMATLVTYGGLFALCAARFRQPPARQLGFVPAPAVAWLALVFLAPSMVLVSEIDNLLKAALPAMPLPPDEGPVSPYAAPAAALVVTGVFPLVYSVFFCGVLQPLATLRLGALPGVLLASVMGAFASGFLGALGTSGGLFLLAPALARALVLCILRQCAGSLWPSLALEVLWGAATVAASYHVFGLAGFDVGGAHTPAPWIAGAGALTLVGFALCRAAARSSKPARG